MEVETARGSPDPCVRSITSSEAPSVQPAVLRSTDHHRYDVAISGDVKEYIAPTPHPFSLRRSSMKRNLMSVLRAGTTSARGRQGPPKITRQLWRQFRPRRTDLNSRLIGLENSQSSSQVRPSTPWSATNQASSGPSQCSVVVALGHPPEAVERPACCANPLVSAPLRPTRGS